MKSVSDVWWKQHVVIEFLVAKKESVRNFHKHLCDFYGSAEVEKSTHSCWANRVIAPRRRKAYPHDLPCSSHLITAICCEMLQHADAIICKDHCITTWQSWKKLLVTSLRISGFWSCAWSGYPGAQSHTKPREESFILSCWHVLKLRERFVFWDCYTRWSLCSLFWNGKKSQSMDWHHAQFVLRKN